MSELNLLFQISQDLASHPEEQTLLKLQPYPKSIPLSERM
jgi:hypothetical protein